MREQSGAEDSLSVSSDEDQSFATAEDLSNISSDDSNISNDNFRHNIMNFCVTNARSLMPKFDSIIDNFDNLRLDFMTVSETWCRAKDHTKIREKFAAEGLGIIFRSRGSRGGGVAIIYSENNFQLKEAYKFSNKFEIVCASGRWIKANRKCVIFSAYLPPKMDSSSVAELREELADRLEKSYQDHGTHTVFLAGDLNKKDLAPALLNFPNIELIDTDPTRGSSHLDLCYSSIASSIIEARPLSPLVNENRISSDHSVCYFKAKIPKCHFFEKRSFYSRKFTTEGEIKFGSRLSCQDWSVLENKGPSEAVSIFTNYLDEWQNECFPLKKHIIRSCDKPWVSKRIKRLIRRRNRSFKRWGKGAEWQRKANIVSNELLMNKVRYLNKIKENMKSGNNIKEYFRAIKLLQTEEPPTKWDIGSLFPGKGNGEISERAAEFFNKISNEFTPIARPNSPTTRALPPTLNQIRKRILKMKKPKSSVPGDIDHRLLSKFAGMLAVPLSIIFRSVYASNEWPELWKLETVSLIPKNKAPESLAQMRNISCTPFFSKLLETFVLEGLKETITLSRLQFGGKKGQGVDHMLIEAWNEIHKALEVGGTSINIMAVDFEKAFNRLDHSKCVSALRQLGGTEQYLGLVSAFLHDRKMTVKVGDAKSAPRVVTGGAPQGSILGCFLFCAYVNSLLQVKAERRPVAATVEDSPPRAGDLNLDDSVPAEPNLTDDSLTGDDSEDELASFFRWHNPRRLNDTIASDNLNNSAVRDFLDLDKPDSDPLTMGYIDDLNVIERLDERLRISHHTTGRTTTKLRADQSELIFERLEELSSDLGMKINPAKTQVLCISTAAGVDAKSFIVHKGSKINSTGELKILGFWFSESPTVNLHVNKMLTKARSRLWSIRNLKRSGMDEPDLLHFYKCFIRPLLDYAVPTYHPQLTKELSSEIERFQASAMKIIYGPLVSYATVVDHNKIETHFKRREQILDKFTSKALANKNFDHWFPKTDPPAYDVRHRETYKIDRYRTERYNKNPVQHMRRLLNYQSRNNGEG